MAKKDYKPVNFRINLSKIDKKNVVVDDAGEVHADFKLMLDEAGSKFTSKDGKDYILNGFVVQMLNKENHKIESDAVKAGTMTDAQRTQMPILGNARIWKPAASSSGIPGGEGRPVTEADVAGISDTLPF